MKKYLFILLIAFLSGFVFGQSDEILDDLYAEEDAKTSHTALVLLQIAGILGEDATLNDAELFLESTEWGNNVLKDGEYITVGGFSLLVMSVYKDLPSGLMFKLFPIKRYATKDMIYNKYILGTPYPDQRISSFDVIYALSSLPSEIN